MSSNDISWTDKFGLYHDREVVFREPASNNGWIYTAYAKALGLPIDKYALDKALFNCEYTAKEYWILNRLPLKSFPPISRDELIGIFFLMGQVGEDYILKIASNGWTWLKHYPDLYNSFSYWDAIRAFWRARKEHRNYLWKQEELAAYPYMFKVNPSDRYYFKTRMGFETTLLEKIMWIGYKYLTLFKGSTSEKNILWLQLFDLKDDFIKKIDREKNFMDYFGPNHVFNLEKK